METLDALAHETPAIPGMPPVGQPRSQVVCLSHTPAAERQALVARMQAVDQQVFIDQAPEKTRAILMGLQDEEAWVMTLEVAGELIGYNFIRFSHYLVNGRQVACWKSRAAVLPAYRGKNRTAAFPAILYRKYRLRHPFRKIYGLIALVHPSSFKLFTESMPRMYPYPTRVLDPEAQATFDLLCNVSGYERLPGLACFVMQATATTRISVLESNYWASSIDPAVVFFLEQNPGYQKGQVLMSFFPIDTRLFLGMAWTRSGIPGKLRGVWDGLSPRARRQRHEEMLMRIFPKLGLEQAVLQKIATGIEPLHLKSDAMLIRVGQAQPSIYLLMQGSLLVWLPTPKGLVVVDQLAPGAIVGEIGALLGVPATATVQAKGKCSLLRLGPRAIQAIREQAPQLLEELRDLCVKRLEMNQSIIGDM
jgi:hypothetical protein